MDRTTAKKVAPTAQDCQSRSAVNVKKMYRMYILRVYNKVMVYLLLLRNKNGTL